MLLVLPALDDGQQGLVPDRISTVNVCLAVVEARDQESKIEQAIRKRELTAEADAKERKAALERELVESREKSRVDLQEERQKLLEDSRADHARWRH